MVSVSPNITKVVSIDSTALELVSVADMGAWLNLSSGAITKSNDMLESLIASAVEIIEKYLWLDLRQKTYEAYYDLGSGGFFSFVNGSSRLTLERAPIQDIGNVTKIEFLNDDNEWEEFDRGAAAAVSGLFDNTTERLEQREWASVYFLDGITFQDRVNAYKVRITFENGFDSSDELTACPETLLIGIKMVVAERYRSRGDCLNCGCDLNGVPVPCDAKAQLDLWSVASTVIGGAYAPANGSFFGAC